MAGFPKRLSSSSQRLLIGALGHAVVSFGSYLPTVGVPHCTGEAMQIIYLIDSGHFSVANHGFESHFPWMEKCGIAAKGVWMTFRFCLASAATICSFESVSVSIRWLADVSSSRIGVEATKDCLDV